jgi:hypothetical protein
MLGLISGVNSPHQKQGKNAYQYVPRKLLAFEVQPRNVVTHPTDVINMNTKTRRKTAAHAYIGEVTFEQIPG